MQSLLFIVIGRKGLIDATAVETGIGSPLNQ
jgi:hypothetical protein